MKAVMRGSTHHTSNKRSPGAALSTTQLTLYQCSSAHVPLIKLGILKWRLKWLDRFTPVARVQPQQLWHRLALNGSKSMCRTPCFRLSCPSRRSACCRNCGTSTCSETTSTQSSSTSCYGGTWQHTAMLMKTVLDIRRLHERRSRHGRGSSSWREAEWKGAMDGSHNPQTSNTQLSRCVGPVAGFVPVL